MSSAEHFTGPRSVFVSSDERAAYGVQAREVNVDDWWVQQKLNAQWIVAARVAFDDRGQPVIAELRLFPGEPRRPPDYPGKWNAEVRGMQARHVPRGGLPATLVRRQLQFSSLEREARELARVMEGLAASGKPLPAVVNAHIEAFRAAGSAVRPRRTTPPNTARGRPPLDDCVLARTALDYVAFLATGTPNVSVAKKHGISAEIVKGRIKTARARGFLTEPDRHGKAGGRVTEKTRSVLKAAGKKSPKG